MKFSYKALQPDGAAILGELEAPDRNAAVDNLTRRGLIPVDVSRVQSGILAALNKPVFTGDGLTPRQLAVFTSELATLVGSGLSLERSLTVLLSLSPDKKTGNLVRRLLNDVREGQSLSAAMQKEAGSFANFYVSMVNSGEVGGNLANVLDVLSAYQTRALEIRERVRSALIYPAILLAMVAVTMLLVVTVILPQFEPMFAQAEDGLPLPTRITLAVGAFVNDNSLLLLVLVAALVLSGIAVLRAESVRTKLHGFATRVPVLGTLVTKDAFSKFHRMLGTLLENGIPLTRAFRISTDGVSNRFIHSRLKSVMTGLQEGRSLSSGYAGIDVIPPLAMELTRVGESTGQLPAMLLKTAGILEGDVKVLVERLMTMLVPFLTISMGLVIAGMIASVLLGIISVNEIVF